MCQQIWVIAALTSFGMGGPVSAAAQRPHASPHEVGRIVAAALEAIVSPWERHSGERWVDRTIRFDYLRTMHGLGLADGENARAALSISQHLLDGTRQLLADCDQIVPKPCTGLANAVYVYMDSLTLGRRAGSAWIHLSWAVGTGTTRSLAGMSMRLFARRSKSGLWTVALGDRGVIS
jgi:hypothetical protein